MVSLGNKLKGFTAASRVTIFYPAPHEVNRFCGSPQFLFKITEWKHFPTSNFIQFPHLISFDSERLISLKFRFYYNFWLYFWCINMSLYGLVFCLLKGIIFIKNFHTFMTLRSVKSTELIQYFLVVPLFNTLTAKLRKYLCFTII